MGKKSTKKPETNSNSTSDDNLLPFVSICTPTYNRRPFWPMAIQCFNEYDYPKDRMEWIIVDDGTDCIEDLVKDIPQVRYFREEDQMVLGRKRNYMHEKAKGDIIVYQDDDDYYPPDRISHAVEKLMSDPKVLAGGSTVLFLYFKHIQQMYRFGPYSQNHATAGTFAFKRELLKETKYDDFKALAEEKDFLKGYTVPFIQFDPLKTILVFSHNHNTFDKKKLLEHAPNPTCNPDMNITVNHIMKSESAKKFFLEDIDELLAAYEPGDIKNKPEVLNQTKLIEEQRAQHMKELSEIRLKTMADKDIQQVKAELQAQVENTKRDMARIFEVNKKLVHRMKAIKHLLTEEDKNMIEETDRRPPVCDIGIINPVLRITQTENMCGLTPESIQNIFHFIENHEVSFALDINQSEKTPASMKCSLEFVPHPSVQHMYINSNQESSTINLTKALGGQQSTNFSEEDIKTIIDQTECNRATAINALGKENGDVIACIMNIDSHKCDDVPSSPSTNFSEEDIKTIMDQAECNRATAINALGKEGGDVIACIMNIDNYKCDDMPSVSHTNFSEEDITTIMEQTECNRATAINALGNQGGDVIASIMNIDNYKCDNLSQTTQPPKPKHLNITVQGVDIENVMAKTGCNEMTAIQALAHEDNDINAAIMSIDQYKVEDNGPMQLSNNMQTNMNNGLSSSNTIEDNIQTIIRQTGCNRETAINALKGENNEVVAAIMMIDQYGSVNNDPHEEDVQSIIEQTDCDKETAIKALKGENNDVISAIMMIDEYKLSSEDKESSEEVSLSIS